MKVEVLVAALGQEPRRLAKEMKLNSDALIINQCDRFSYDEWEDGGHRFRAFSFAERGVGLSRNSAMMRAEGDICLFSDQDIIYEAGYEKKVLEEFEKNPHADMLIFNIEVEAQRRTYFNTFFLAAAPDTVTGKTVCLLWNSSGKAAEYIRRPF